MKVFVENTGKFDLSDKNYLAGGGEGKVYTKSGLAFKIYHDSSRMIPGKKIEELINIKNDNVIKPLNTIYDISSNKPIGFTMNFISESNPLCKFFVKTFKERLGIGHSDIASLIKEMQKTVVDIHKANCLIADFNEMNVSISKDNKTPYFIDVDSYQTPSFRATAISDSVRDRKVPFGTFNEFTDWYAFAILAFQMYINIHPYRGTHPKYDRNDIDKRMEDGVSVLDSVVKLPPVCYDFSVIPKPHMDWFKNIFIKNDRSIPPMPDATSLVAVIQEVINIIRSHGNFEVEEILTLDSPVKEMFNIMGVGYVISEKSIFKGGKKIISDIGGYDDILLCESDSMVPVVCYLKDNEVTVKTINGEQVGDKFAATSIMYANGSIYSLFKDTLQERVFKSFGNKTQIKIKIVGNVSEISSKMFDGCIYQDLLGKPWFQIPFAQNNCVIKYIKELDGYRILDAKYEKNYLIVMAEKKGLYSRFVLIFDSKINNYSVRITDNVQFENINFTVLQSGVCLLVSGSEVELFMDNKTIKSIQDPPFDASTKVYNTLNGVYYVDGNKIYSAKIKK